MSGVLFGKLISQLQLSTSPTQREEVLIAVSTCSVFTCQQLGIILTNLKYSAEREAASSLLAPRVVDPENALTHLLPYVACESWELRDRIVRIVNSGGRDS